MSLPAYQQRALESIDNALQAAEPRLAAMFAIFTRLTSAEALPGRECLGSGPRWLGRARSLPPFVVIPITLALVACGLLIGAAAIGGGGCHGRLAPRSVMTASGPVYTWPAAAGSGAGIGWGGRLSQTPGCAAGHG